MRHVYLILAGCVVMMLLGVGLLFLYDRAWYDLTLPDAVDLRVDDNAIARRQQIAYRLPSNRTISDLYVQLQHHGWSRDGRAEQRLKRDQMDYTALGAFTRQHLFGMLSEIAVIRVSATDLRVVRIELFRCFTMNQQLGCW